ncbi:tail length tape measure protein [Streptomyces phage Caliburn]|uniref:Tape measure protein n=2 Tax=Likavirus caliburn TaxID=1982885 RepID=A0A291AV56_9CAUD|nr:tail length tape measure protein [Streptomyces phage Caliburn]AKY03328.1 tape measure protein [Streptomyces phage Caliburn]ATE84897.1 tape measure protein [Streptomyces phage BeardedLady]URQ04933.1 tape measure protein [Streptomyces phage Legacy]
MAGPGGQEIGRVSVKVLPDTSRFRRDAEKALDRIEKTLQPLKISTKIDMSGASREFLQELRKINQRNRQLDSRKIRFHTTISKDGMTEAVSRAVRQIQEKADQRKIKLTLDGVDVKSDVELVLNRQAADRVKDEIKDWAKDISPLKIQVEPDFSAVGARVTAARLAVLTRPRTVSIIPKLNEAALAKVATSLAALSGIRVVNNLFRKFGNILKNLDKNVPIIGTIATAIAGVGAWALSATSNLFALSASLAQIGAVGLTLPGILGGFAVGLGVTIAALKDFNTVLPQVKTQLSELQNQISSNFWAEAKAPIAELVDTLLPRFAEGFRATATESGKFFASFATDLTAALNPKIVDTMFGYLNSSIQEATKGTGVFASIIAQLGEVGTSYLPNLAGWFVNISKQFDEWLKKKGQIGLRAEIDQGIQALKDLGGILYETVGILGGVARAAEQAGGSSLGMLRDTLKSVHEVVDSEPFQKGLVGVFEAAHRAMSNLANGAGPAVKNLFIELSSLLTTILPQAGSIIGTAMGAIADALSQTVVMDGIKAMFTALYQAVQLLAPAMAPLGQALGAIMQVIAAMLPVFAQLVSAAVIPLANAFAELAPQLIPIVELLGGALTSAFQMLAPIIAQMVPLVGDLLGAAFSFLSTILPPVAAIFREILAAAMPLAEAFIGALAPILPVLASALKTVLTALQPIVAVALEIITAVITPLLPMLSEVIQSILPPLAEAIQRLLEAIQPILDALLAVVNFLMPVLVPVIQFIAVLLGETLVAAVNGVALVFEGLVEVVVGVWDIIVGALKFAWGVIKAIFTGNTDTLKAGWNQFWSGIWSFVKGIWDIILGAFRVFLSVGILGTATKVLKAIGNAFKAGWQAVVNFGKSAWSAITSGFSSFVSWLTSRVSSAMSSIGGFFSRGWTSIRETATGALSKLISEVGKWIGKAITTIGELPGKAKSALGDLGSVLMSAGRKLIQGFINGVKNMFGSVKSTLGDLTSKLTSWKGPESLDRVLLVGAGELVINGFINGLESRYDAVRKSLKGLTEDVAKTEFDAPSIGQVRAARGITAAVTGALDGSLGEAGVTKVLNYYAAPGSSISSEEDLFGAANRARMVGW